MIKNLSVVPLSTAPSSPSDIFGRFTKVPWSMFLDSGDSGRKDATHSILLAQPVATLTYDGSTSQVHHCLTDTHENVDESPFDCLESLQNRYFGNVANAPFNLPFIVGVAGLFGYDLGRSIEQFETIATNPHHTPDMAVGLFSWSLVFDHIERQWWYCYCDNYPHPTENEVLQWFSKPSTWTSPFQLSCDWLANQSKAQYENNIARINQHLCAGDCYQVNYAQRFKSQYKGDEWHAYLMLKASNNAPFSAYIKLPNSTILSISPERFIQINPNGTVETKPIKGTKPRGNTQAEDLALREALQTSEKDKAENLMIVDLLRNDISKHCKPGTVKVPTLFEINTFASVHHMISTVVGELGDNANPLSLLRDAFPGGSITGAPKIRAMQVIESLEPDRRNIYCGSIGYIGINGDMDTSICIRTLLCEPPNIYCWAGGGIVLDSKASAEYQESLDKVSKILPVLSETLPEKG